MYTNSVGFGTLISVAFGSITTSYVQAGSSLPTPATAVAFKNNTNGIILVSTDGINDMLVYPAASYGVYDLRTNAPNNVDYLLSAGTPFMIKYSGSAPTSGSFYIETVLTNLR